MVRAAAQAAISPTRHPASPESVNEVIVKRWPCCSTQEEVAWIYISRIIVIKGTHDGSAGEVQLAQDHEVSQPARI